jgi:hypothetical protein
MASQPIIETKKINGGKWNDLDTYWNVTTTLFFNFPVGAIILVRYGSNISWLGNGYPSEDGRGSERR